VTETGQGDGDRTRCRYGTGPFARTVDLRAGDAMTLTASDGTARRYAVASVDAHRETALPYERIVAQTGPTRVVVVTCGGDYHRDAGGWDSNVVVTLVPV
jgi:hypothetical protein